MENAMYLEALEALHLPLSSLNVETIREGLINHSYKVSDTGSGASWFLQRINRHVFPDPAGVQKNYLAIRSHLDQQKMPFLVPRPILFPGNQPVYIDSQGEYWRAVEYIPYTYSPHQPDSIGQAANVAAAFAQFALALSTLDPTAIGPTLTGFHDLGLRYRQFSSALDHPVMGRMEKCRELTGELQQRTRYVSLFEYIRGSDRFACRLMHHDAKIGNVLFDTTQRNIRAIVDLDTVMPGYFFSDLGDMIRSMAGSIPEDGNVQEQVALRPDYYEAIVNAYRGALGPSLSEEENKHLHYSGLFLIYMQCLRFLTDYLSGDTYYQCSYPEQNLDRAKNQLSLLQALENYIEQQQYLPHD